MNMQMTQSNWLRRLAGPGFVAMAVATSLAFPQPKLALRNADAFEYLRGAETLLRDKAYLGLHGGPQTLFPPGYSLAIAGMSSVCRDPVRAALLVSLLAGALSCWLLFGLVRRWYGFPTAACATGMYVLLPIRVWLSQSVLSESLMVFLVLLGVWILEQRSWRPMRRGLCSGVVFGAAVLTRPEAMIAALGLMAVPQVHRFRERANRRLSVSLGLGLMLLLVPYMIWVHGQTGRWSITGKTGNVRLGMARHAVGAEVEWRRLGEDGKTIEVAAPRVTPARMAIHYARNAWHLKERMFANFGVEPLAEGLILLGLLALLRRALWGHEMRQGLVIGVLLLPLAVFPLFWTEDRFLVQIAPAMSICMALGAGSLSRLLRGSTTRGAVILGRWAASLCMAGILASYVLRLHTVSLPPQDTASASEVARVIIHAAKSQNPAVVGEHPAVAYFSGARHIWLPYSELTALLAYARAHEAEFLVLSPLDSPTPSTTAILAGQLPASLRLLYRAKPEGYPLFCYQLVEPKKTGQPSD